MDVPGRHVRSGWKLGLGLVGWGDCLGFPSKENAHDREFAIQTENLYPESLVREPCFEALLVDFGLRPDERLASTSIDESIDVLF